MAEFDASISLKLTTEPALRAVKKVERNLGRIEDATRDILSIDKKIVSEKRRLVGLEGQSATNARKRIADLRLQRTELTLQKRELQAINSIERRRSKSLGVTFPGEPQTDRQQSSSPIIAFPLSNATKVNTEAKKLEGTFERINTLDEINFRNQRDISRQFALRNGILRGQQQNQEKLNELVEERADLTKRLNTINKSADPAKTANLFLPEKFKLSNRGEAELKKVNARIKEQNIGLEEAERLRDSVYKRFTLSSTQQIKKAERAQETLNTSIEETETRIKQQARAYESVNTKLRQLDAQERRRALNVEATFDKIEARERKAEQRRRRNQGIKTGVGAGLATANLPGQEIISAGIAGAALGGKPGFLVGVATAGLVKAGAALAAFGKESAIVRAEFEKLQISLKSVAGSNFEDSLKTAKRITEDFNTPLKDSVANLTKLVAAGNSVGLEFKDVDTIIRGLSASNKALGGDQEKLNGILNAAVQILSKNKVQAEELRGQIGDRLPGAVGRFAESLKISGAELDQRLKDGKVTVADFVRFTQGELDKYEKAAKTIADSPAEAGERLKTALTNLNLAVGPELQNLGAQFQDFATESIKALTGLFDFLDRIADRLEEASGASLKNVGTLIRNREIAQKALTAAIKKQAETPTSDIAEQTRLQGIIDINLKAIKDIEKRLNKIGGVEPITTKTQQGNGNAPDPDAAARAAAAEKRLRTAQQAVFTQRELNRLAEDLVRAEIRGDQATAARLRGVRDELAIQNRLKAALETETDARVRAAFEQRAALEIDEIRIRVGGELARIQADSAEDARQANEERIRQLQEQRRLLLDAAGLVETIAGTVANTGGNPLKSVTDQIRTLQNQAKFGKNADLVGQLEDLVLNQGVGFNEAFNAVEQLRQQRELNAATQEYQNLLNGIGGTITDGLVRGLTAAVTETDRLGEAFQDLAAEILNSIGQALILAGIQGALSSLGGNDGGVGFFSKLFPKREKGGPVEADRPFIVGERGPELFVPNQSGEVFSNDESSRAFSDAAGALRGDNTSTATTEEADEAFAVAAQANEIFRNNSRERIQERNTETFFQESAAQMSSNNSMNIRFDSRVINNVEYVTADQFKEGLSTTANQARAQVFADMRNKPSVRRSLGM